METPLVKKLQLAVGGVPVAGRVKAPNDCKYLGYLAPDKMPDKVSYGSVHSAVTIVTTWQQWCIVNNCPT